MPRLRRDALGYLGGDVPLDKKIGERIEIYDSASKQLKTEVPIDRPGQIAYHPNGRLVAVSGDIVCRSTPPPANIKRCLNISTRRAISPSTRTATSTSSSRHERLSHPGVRCPGTSCCDDRQPGPRKAGPWDPEVIGQVIDIDVDRRASCG